MKFQFKIQGYQTEAVEDTVNVFRGQPKRDPKHYRRDVGKIAKGSIFSEEEEQVIVMLMLNLTRSGFSTIYAIFRFRTKSCRAHH